MAAAEARAAWQRAANRFFVQEDAKRAPKLPSPPLPCSYSSSTSSDDDLAPHTKNQSDDQHQQLILHLSPFNRNPYPINTANLPPDTQWWLQLHPNFAYQRELLLYDPKIHVHPSDSTNPISPDPPKTSLSMSFSTHGNSNINSTINRTGQDTKLRYDVKYHSCDGPLMPKNREPWWRIADGEELASMVAWKSTQNVENCDLPKPTQTLLCYSCADLYPDPTAKVGMAAFANADLDDNDLPPRKVFPDGSLHSIQRPFCSRDNKLHMDCYTRSKERRSDERKGEVGKGSREELLEALCHSQTRAREAEMAAKKAYSEKEDIMKLLFRQASHLFACKQWLKMLQLENLCLQLRIRDHCVPFNSKQPPQSPSPPPPPHCCKPAKIPRGKSRSICRYVVLFAVGWGLAGAGLLFGWTLGWLLPRL